MTEKLLSHILTQQRKEWKADETVYHVTVPANESEDLSDSQVSHGGRRELTPTRYSLTTIHAS